jgi:hypothetical protein
MAFQILQIHIEYHANGSKPPFLRAFAKVVSSDEPRTKREALYREAPPSLPSVLLPLIQSDFTTVPCRGAARFYPEPLGAAPQLARTF